MPRPRRLQVPGACYYVALQGNNKQDLFMSNQDRRSFLSLLKIVKERYDLKVYAYCLMAHDAYLLLETSKPNLSAAMQAFNTLYTKYFNGAHNTSGHLFHGRYKALVVDKDHLLAEVTRFIHLQPARGGLRDKPWRYVWSSCAAYVASEESEPLVDTGPVLAQFARLRLKQSVRYLQYIKDRLKSASDLVLPIAGGVAIGGPGFLARMQERSEAAAEAAAAKPSGVQDARRILEEVGQSTGVPIERLTGPLQWREITRARRQAVYRIWREAGLGVTALSRLFNRTPAAISQIIRAMERAGEAVAV